MVAFMRPSDDPIVALGLPMQIPHGALLALALVSFRSVIVSPRGWPKLWFLIWVLTGIGAVITGPGSLAGMVYTRLGFSNPLVGLPAVTLQTLAFAGLLRRWERRVDARQIITAGGRRGPIVCLGYALGIRYAGWSVCASPRRLDGSA